jgi:MFS family permease
MKSIYEMTSSIALGRISAAFMVGQLRLRRRGITAFAGDIWASLALLALVLPLPLHWLPVLGLVAGFVFGTGGGTFQTIWVTLLQELTPSDKLGRVASIDLLGSFCLQPLGFLLAGHVADSFGPRWVIHRRGTTESRAVYLSSVPTGYP